MDIYKKYLLLCPGQFGKHPGSETIITAYSKDGVKTTIEKNEAGGSAGTVKLDEPCKNILEINCINTNCVINNSIAILLPEIAPYGAWDQLPFTDPANMTTYRKTINTAPNYEIGTYKIKPHKLPPEFNKNWFPVIECTPNASTSYSGRFSNTFPIKVATRKKGLPPFTLDKLTALCYVLQSHSFPTVIKYNTVSDPTLYDDQRNSMIYYDPQNSYLNSTSTNNIFENNPSSQFFICLEVVMLDETPHIARNPTPYGEVEAYENEFEVTNRQRRTASELNNALRARLKHVQ